MNWLFIIFLFITKASVAQESLRNSYQREVLFLNNYKAQLQKQIEELEKTHIKREAAAQEEMAWLQKKLIHLVTKNEKWGQKLLELEREQENMEESSQQLQAIIEQSRQQGDVLTSRASMREALQKVFAQSTAELQRLTRLESEKGDFFLKTGEKTEGLIFTWGGIAKYGISAEGQGVLYPVGGNKFKIWQELSPPQVNQLQHKQLFSPLPAFLFENAEIGFVPKESKTVLQTIQAGGSIAWVIVILGLVALTASILRIKFLFSAQGTAIENIKKSVVASLQQKPESIEDVIEEKILEESKLIDRFGQFIVVLAAVAPLLGLLGTVTGMIATFDTITQFGTGNPKLLSGGISEALITTMLGLMVAIPTLLVGNFLNSWSQRIKEEMERVALGLCNNFFTESLGSSSQ